MLVRNVFRSLIGREKLVMGHCIETPAGLRRARLHYQLIDHGFLRYLWTNFAPVAPGVYRSNHPHAGRLKSYHFKGIRAVLNLRGANEMPSYLLETVNCKTIGLDLISVRFSARGAPLPDKLQELFSIFDTIPRPFIIHCKSGADRAGLVSVLYLLDQGVPLAQARKHLSLRYLHLKWTKTGVQDALLDVYAARLARGPISIRDWVATEYDPEEVRALFASRRILNI